MIPHIDYYDREWAVGAHHQGYRGPGWYFWDETGAYCHGPYVAEIIAAKALDLYAYNLDKNTIKLSLDFDTTELVTIVAPVDRAHAHHLGANDE